MVWNPFGSIPFEMCIDVLLFSFFVALWLCFAFSASLTLILIMWCTNFILVGGFHYPCSSSDSHSTKSRLLSAATQFSACTLLLPLLFSLLWNWIGARMHFKGQLSSMLPSDSLVFVMKPCLFFHHFLCLQFRRAHTGLHWDMVFFVLACKQMRLCVNTTFKTKTV